jgi:hypothetical protein
VYGGCLLRTRIGHMRGRGDNRSRRLYGAAAKLSSSQVALGSAIPCFRPILDAKRTGNDAGSQCLCFRHQKALRGTGDGSRRVIRVASTNAWISRATHPVAIVVPSPGILILVPGLQVAYNFGRTDPRVNNFAVFLDRGLTYLHKDDKRLLESWNVHLRTGAAI